VNVTDKLYTEWAWRTKTGVPDINNPEDRAILDSILLEYGVFFEDENGNQVELDAATELTNKEVKMLIDAINSIKEDYGKYLTVFAYFDNNSLGTISEVLLTKLLNKAGISATHTGASGGLADLYINGKPVSLKTTAGDKAIGLGQDEVKSTPITSRQVVQALQKIDLDSVNNVYDLEEKLDNQDYKFLVDRINVIAEKLAGPQNQEFFVWVEKNFTRGILDKIIIHIHKYDLSKVKQEMMSYKPYHTDKAWGLKDQDGKVMVQADASGKLHSIQPAFVRKTTTDTAIPIELISDIEGLDKASVSKNITDSLLGTLDKIYNSEFVK
jgi:hypothetical protein